MISLVTHSTLYLEHMVHNLLCVTFLASIFSPTLDKGRHGFEVPTYVFLCQEFFCFSKKITEFVISINSSLGSRYNRKKFRIFLITTLHTPLILTFTHCYYLGRNIRVLGILVAILRNNRQ